MELSMEDLMSRRFMISEDISGKVFFFFKQKTAYEIHR